MIRLAFATLLACTTQHAVAAQPSAEPEFPQLSVATVAGATFELAQQRGRWVVVNFWATWCAPCRKEMPELAQLDRDREDLVVVGLAFEEIEQADLEKFLAANPVDYPIALVDFYSPPADFPAPRALPTTYLVDPEGRVAKRWLGPVTREEIDKAAARRAPGA